MAQYKLLEKKLPVSDLKTDMIVLVYGGGPTRNNSNYELGTVLSLTQPKRTGGRETKEFEIKIFTEGFHSYVLNQKILPYMFLDPQKWTTKTSKDFCELYFISEEELNKIFDEFLECNKIKCEMLNEERKKVDNEFSQIKKFKTTLKKIPEKVSEQKQERSILGIQNKN